MLAHNGNVTAQYCENCTIITKTIHIERAVNCEIVGEEVRADVVEGCMIAAESIKILASSESKSRETFITMMIPDLSSFDQSMVDLQKKRADCKASVAGMEKEAACEI